MMTTNTEFTSSDLVLRLIDGSDEGKLFPVKTNKCKLGNNISDPSNSTSYCAIMRGPQGTAIRSFGDFITINGRQVESDWLKQGDQIQLGESRIEVFQLGHVAQQPVPSSFETRTESTSELHAATCDSTEFCESRTVPAEISQSCSVLNHAPKNDDLDSNRYANSEEDHFASEESTSYASPRSVDSFSCDKHTLQTNLAPSFVNTTIDNENEAFQQGHAAPQFTDHTPDESLQSDVSSDSSLSQNETADEESNEFADCYREFVGDVDYQDDRESESILYGQPDNEISGDLDSAPESNARESQMSASELRARELEELFGRLNADVIETSPDGEAVIAEAMSAQTEANPTSEEFHTDYDDEEVFVTTSDDNSEFTESLRDPAGLDKFDTSEFENYDGQLKPLAEISEQIHFELGQQNEPSSGIEAAFNSQSEQFNSVSNTQTEIDGTEEYYDNELSTPQSSWKQTLEQAVGELTTNRADHDSEILYTPADAAEDSVRLSPAIEAPTESWPQENFPEEQLPDSLTPPQETSEEPVANEPNQPVPAREENLSVAEVLARMQAQGQLNDFVPPSDDESSPTSSTPLPDEPVENAHVAQTIEDENSENDHSVEDYMNRLLGRMGNQGKQKPQASAQTTSVPKEVEEMKAKSVKAEEPVVLLTASEYKPAKTAPEKNKNLDAMRELANQNNRAALQSSSKRRAKAIAITNLSIMGLGFCLSMFMISNSAGVSDLFFWMGAATLGLSLGMGAIGAKAVMSLKK